MAPPAIVPPHFRCRAGAARADITPPVGIYARSWGAAQHDQAEGVHRPLLATALILADTDGRAGPCAVLSLDLGWWHDRRQAQRLLASLCEATGLTSNHVLLALSHTHSGPTLNRGFADRPGGEHIGPYLERLSATLVRLIERACSELQPAWITFGSGSCGLAVHRDFHAPDGQWVCGTNPAGPTDSALLAARVASDAGLPLAHIVNYACHPVSLAWRNRLISPDFVGAMRDEIESRWDAPTLFLQGASGDLNPRDCYSGDPAVADRNGRQLGLAVASVLEGLPPAGTQSVYAGALVSGANLGVWETRPLADGQVSTQLNVRQIEIELPLKADFPSLEELQAQGAAETDRVQRERIDRRIALREALGAGPVDRMGVWLWRLGDAVLVGIANEGYHILQKQLRARFPRTPLFVSTVTNGGIGYLPPREAYEHAIYQVNQTPYAAGCLETTIETLEREIWEML